MVLTEMTKYRLIYKCPECGKRPRASYHPIANLQVMSCCRMIGAKRTTQEAIEAWNVLAESAWHRKSTTSTRDQPLDSPASTSPS